MTGLHKTLSWTELGQEWKQEDFVAEEVSLDTGVNTSNDNVSTLTGLHPGLSNLKQPIGPHLPSLISVFEGHNEGHRNSMDSARSLQFTYLSASLEKVTDN